jgi:hypothetical protein
MWIKTNSKDDNWVNSKYIVRTRLGVSAYLNHEQERVIDYKIGESVKTVSISDDEYKRLINEK